MNDRTEGRHHSLTAEQFAALARGGGDAGALEQLVAAQRSKHLILLGKVAELARRDDRRDDALGVAGYRLLARVQRQAPATAAQVIGYPSVGAWALHVIRAVGEAPANEALAGGTPVDEASAGRSQAGRSQAGQAPEARPSGLAAVAAAAAVRAGLDAEIGVPVVGGTVFLPSLGAAEAVGDTAIVDTGAAEVRSGDARVTMRPGAPGWRELRGAAVGSLDVLIDDLDPFRMPETDSEPTGRLAPPQVAELRDTLRAAWRVIPPASAAEVAAAVRVIVPYTAPESGQASATSPQAFGAVAMSRHPDEYTCAETLVHETQHLKLGALLDLVTLTRPDDGRRYYAPWRPDPRPASGLLQGAYAFFGISGFWREQRRVAPEPEVRQRGHAEFARWRDGAAVGVETLLGSGQLTEAGRDFVTEMARILGEWRREPVPGEALALARRKAARHLAQWRADNG
ncbi:MAG: HEXXH motif domain-containing protein [Nocardiopsaceae bacterium]|nr:HEXXH motif domain-containing protein [Nocardiopsaceae bacterium]